MTKERVIGILVDYVDNDLASADPGYVREVLRDVCGCTDEELKELGIYEWLAFDECEEQGEPHMIIRKKMESGKRSASAWICDEGIWFGVTDYHPALGFIAEDENGDATLYIYKNRCEDANVKIKYI